MADLHNAGFAKTAYAKLEYVTCLNRCESENMSNITQIYTFTYFTREEITICTFKLTYIALFKAKF